jgi:cytochrome c-type biogenesis protein CcmH/NrfG
MRAWLQRVALLLAVVPGGSVALAEKTSEAGVVEGISQEGPTEAGLEEEFRRSRDALRASPEFKGNDAEAHYRLGEVLGHRGDLTGAAEEYRAAIRLKPEFAEAYRGPMGAAEALRLAVELKPDNADTHHLLETVMIFRHDPDQVARAARRILDTLFARE